MLTDAGYQVIVPDRGGLLRLDLDHHRPAGRRPKRLCRLLDILGPYAAQGIPIVGLEPSCTAVLRSDLLDLLPTDPRASAGGRGRQDAGRAADQRDAAEQDWQAT